MRRRHELTDAEWELIAPLMPPPSRGRAWADHRTIINGVLYWAATGVPWRDLPERFGPWQTVYERFRRWQQDGTWLRILRHLQGEADRRGLIDWSLFAADSTNVRASRAAGGAKSKGAASRPTTRWAGRAAASARSCTWSPSAAAGCRWASP
jgi:transposase